MTVRLDVSLERLNHAEPNRVEPFESPNMHIYVTGTKDPSHGVYNSSTDSCLRDCVEQSVYKIDMKKW